MTTKDEALRLADSLERMSLSTKWDKQAAAELRRLHAVNQELLDALTVIQSQFESMAVADWRKWEELASPEEFERWVKSRAAHMAEFACAAIAKATGEQA